MSKSFLEYYREVGAKGDKLFEALAKMGEDGVMLASSIIAGAHECVTKKISCYPSNIGGKKFHSIEGISFLRNEKIAVLCTAGRGNKNEHFFFIEDGYFYTPPFDLVHPPIVKSDEVFILYRNKATREWVLFYHHKDTTDSGTVIGKTKEELYSKLYEINKNPDKSRIHNSFGLIEYYFNPDATYGWDMVKDNEYSNAKVHIFLHNGCVYLTRHK